MGYNQTAYSLPDEGRLVETISPSGDPGVLKRSGNLWFIADGSMYVYYTPKFWRYL